jgi:pimeloyl-ACP methyl ester carboxylesterase
MAFVKFFSGWRRAVILTALMCGTLIVLLPATTNTLTIMWSMNTSQPVQIDTVSYVSNSAPDGQSWRIVADLYHPMYNLTKQCPAIVAVHGFAGGIGKEIMARWASELAERGFVVLAIDLAGQGSTIGGNEFFPSVDAEPYFIQDGITYLKTLPYVNPSEIGLLGHSYGGAAVSMAAGVLGNLVNATVAMSPGTNWTAWLTQDVLPNTFHIPSSQIVFYPDRIETGLTLAQKTSVMNLLALWRGENPELNYLFMPDPSTALNLTTMHKFDAVEVLPNARPNSVMFIHGGQDAIFGSTNQAELGVSVTPGAVDMYFPNEDHDLQTGAQSGNFSVDLAVVNFFEQKLMGVALPDKGSTFATYTQTLAGDPGFSYYPTLATPMSILNLVVAWIVAAVLAGIVISLFVYEKRFKPWRIVVDEAQFVKLGPGEDPNPDDIQRVRQPTYIRVFFYLGVMVTIFYVCFTAGALGIFTNQVTGTFLVVFYVASFLAIRGLPNDSELKECNFELDRNDTPKEALPLSRKMLGTIFVVVALAGLFGAIFTGNPVADVSPGDALCRVLFYAGVALVGSSLAFMAWERKKLGRHTSWEIYHLSRPRVVRGFALGLIVFLNIAMIWQVTAEWIKLPFPMAPHSPEYIFDLVGVILFSLGLELWIEGILRSRFPTDGMKLNNRIRPRLKLIALGCVIVFVVSFLAFLPITLTTLVPLEGIFAGALPAGSGGLVVLLPVILPLASVFIFLVARAGNLAASDREVTFTATFYPMLLFWILAFFFHI